MMTKREADLIRAVSVLLGEPDEAKRKAYARDLYLSAECFTNVSAVSESSKIVDGIISLDIRRKVRT